MIIRGVPFLSLTSQDVLGWGADYGPLTLNGQWCACLRQCSCISDHPPGLQYAGARQHWHIHGESLGPRFLFGPVFRGRARRRRGKSLLASHDG